MLDSTTILFIAGAGAIGVFTIAMMVRNHAKQVKIHEENFARMQFNSYRPAPQGYPVESRWASNPAPYTPAPAAGASMASTFGGSFAGSVAGTIVGNALSESHHAHAHEDSPRKTSSEDGAVLAPAAVVGTPSYTPSAKVSEPDNSWGASQSSWDSSSPSEPSSSYTGGGSD